VDDILDRFVGVASRYEPRPDLAEKASVASARIEHSRAARHVRCSYDLR